MGDGRDAVEFWHFPVGNNQGIKDEISLQYRIPAWYIMTREGALPKLFGIFLLFYTYMSTYIPTSTISQEYKKKLVG